MMTCPIEPHAGDRVSANLIREIIRYLRAITPLQGRGVRLTYGPNGTRFESLPENRRVRKPKTGERPWALSASMDKDGNAHVALFIPDGSLVFDGETISAVAIEGISPIEGNDDHYQLETADGSGERLVVLRAKRSEEDGEEDGDIVFSVALATDDDEPEEDVLAFVPIGRIVSGDDKDGHRTVGQIEQLAVGTVVLVHADSPDETSVDADGGDEGEHKLQIAHFNDTERDSGKGLEKRLKVDTETGEVTAEDSEGLMLVGRKEGKIIYIPLSGDGEDPEEAEPEPGDPCDHDKGGGSKGGVSPDREKEPGSNLSATGGGPGGGVSARGEKHRGDDGCNCK